MKKLILPLLLLVAFGMLAAVESDPSEVVGYVKYTTATGTNYIGLPMVSTFTMAGQVGDSFGTGAVTSVGRFNNATKIWQTTNKVGTMWIGNFAVNNADNLFINGTASIGASFYSIGDLPATMPAWSFYTGLNYFTIPLNKASLNTITLLGNNMGSVNSIARFNNSTKIWQTSNKVGTMWIGSYTVAIGDPLMANATANFTWPVRGTVESPLTISK